MRQQMVTFSDDELDMYSFVKTRRGEQRAIERFHRDDAGDPFVPAGGIAVERVVAMAFVNRTNQLLVMVEETPQPWKLLVYGRDRATGALSLEQTLVLVDADGVDVRGLDLSVPADGNHVYLVSGSEDGYGLLQREAGDTWSVVGFVDNPSFFGASPVYADGGRRLYVLAIHPNPRIEIYDRDIVSGALTLIGDFGREALPNGERAIIDNRTMMDISVDGEVLYLIGRFGYLPFFTYDLPDRLTVLRRDSTSGALTFVETHDVDAINDIFNVKAGADPDIVHLTTYDTDVSYDAFAGAAVVHFDTFRRDTDDRLTRIQRFDSSDLLGQVMIWVSSVHPEAFAWTRYGASGIRRLSLGALEEIVDSEWIGFAGEQPGFAGVYSILPVSGGTQLIVPSWPYKSVYSLAPTATGMTVRSLVRTGAGMGGEVTVPMSYYATLTPDESHLYVYQHGPQLIKLDVDPVEKTIHWDGSVMDLTPESLTIVTDLVFSGDGRFGYLCSQFRFGNGHNDVNAGVTVLERDDAGNLSTIQTYDSGHGRFVNNYPGPAQCALARDGRHLYLANRNSREMQIYRVDPSAGLVTFQEFLTDGDQSIDGWAMEGLMEATSITISDDDRFMYVTADEIYRANNWYGEPTNTTTVLVFRRDIGTGKLTLIQMLARGRNDAAGQPVREEGGSWSGTLSPDGALFAIVTRSLRNFTETIQENGYAVDVYRVDRQSGLLSHAQRIRQGLAGDGVSAAAFLRDGRLAVLNDRVGGVSLYRQQ